MSKDFDEVMRKLDQGEKISEFAEMLGCNEMQRRAFVRLFDDGKVLSWNGVRLLFHVGDGTTTTAVDDERCKQYLKEQVGFLFPPEKAADTRTALPEIPQELVEKALTGNQTARAQIAHRAFGDDTGATDLYLQGKRHGGGLDTSVRAPSGENYWGKEWNITKQGAYLRRMGEKAAADMAARAGSFIGATKPAAST